MKHKARTKALSWLLSLALALSLVPGMGLTAKAALPDKVYYRVYDYSDSKLTYTDNEIAGTGATEVTSGTTEWANGTYVVSATTTISSRITVTGTVNLIIFDGATLTADKGITVSNGNTLNIYMGSSSNSIQSTGQLNATALKDNLRDEYTHVKKECLGAGIGGYCERSSEPGGPANYEKSGCGNVNIHGGSISVQYVDDNDNVAGIGGSLNGAGGNITIYYGSVTAYSYRYVSAIGAGYNGSGGNIAVYGGEVNAIVAATVSNSTKNGFGGTLTVGKDVQVYALQGSKSPNEDLSGQTNVAPEGGGQVTTFNNSMFTRYTGPAPVSSHEHNFTYSANGATITATCNTDGCTLPESKATLTIAAPQHTAVGDDKSADAQITDANNIKGDAAVSYYKANNDNTRGDALNPQTTAPTDGGKYWAEITLTNGGSGANDSATAHVVYEITDSEYTVTLPTGLTGGTVEADKTSAKFGETVTLTARPTNENYILKTLAVKDADGADVALTDNKFTMPASNVTVSATFAEKSSGGVTLTTGENGTASLLKDSTTYAALTASDTIKEGDRFILSVSPNDGYDYNITCSPNAGKIEAFSADEYKAYAQYIEEHNIYVPTQTNLYWVTMPNTSENGLSINIAFSQIHDYTILYQPKEGENPTTVWCKFIMNVNDQDHVFASELKRGATMPDGSAVWSVKAVGANAPTKIAFAATQEAVTAIAEKAMADVTVQTSATWAGSDEKWLVIGGAAKTVMAIFTDDNSSANTDRKATVISIGNNAKYQIAICASGGSGSVTTPAAPTKDGYDFVAWRGYEGITAKDYDANTQISVKENMTFSAVWQPKNPNVKLNLNGGTGIGTTLTVPYNTTLASLTPVKSGYSFAGWSVAKDVTEDGKVYTNGAPFDTGTKITADLELTAQWKHVHAYGCVQIGDISSLATKYAAYAPYLHIKICGCGDVDLEAHSLNSDGVCACGYSKSGAAPTSATLDVSYVRQSDNHTMMAELPETVAADSEVSVSAPGKWGNLTFSKWQYKAEGDADWTDAGAYKMMSFVIPGNMEMRALYVNATAVPEVSMSATTYETTASDGNLYDSILFQMNYKLPDGYTYVDAGVRSGDNAGISYYELKERTATMDAEAKAITYSLAAAMSVLSGELTTFDTSGTEQYYAKRENSVLEESGMTAAKLGEYMYQSKPINIKDPPLYWNYKPTVTGQSGSINALTPVGFAQRNDGNHYIYAIAYLTYKDSSETTHTIYTPALATTLNGISSAGTVSKRGL